MSRRAHISKFDDYIDVRDVIERIEELEGSRRPWVAGWNMPGYMPDSEPCGFEGFEDARRYIVRAMLDAAESQIDLDNDGEAGRLTDAADRWETACEGEHGETVGEYHYFINRAGCGAFESADDAHEYAALSSLLSDLKGAVGNTQWRGGWYPVTLIRDSYFVTAMQELCEDMGDFPNGVPSYYVIDWEATARNLRADYSAVEYEDVTYWYR